MSESDTVKIKLEVDGSQAKTALREVDAAVAGTARSADQAGASVRDYLGGYNEARAAAASLVSLGRSLLESAAGAERNARAVSALGTAYAAVQAATQGTVTATQALQAQQSLVQSGLRVSGEELATITRRARDYALATGTETTQAIGQLVDALRGGEAEGLRRFGIAVRAGETDTHLFHRALRELGTQMSSNAPAAHTLAEEIGLLNTNSTNLGGSMAALVTSGLGLTRVLTSLNALLRDVGETADHVSRMDRQRATDEATQDARQQLNRTIGSAATRLRTGGASLGIGNANQYTAEQARALIARIERDNRDAGISVGAGTLFGGTAAAAVTGRAGPVGASLLRTARGLERQEFDLGIGGLAAQFRFQNDRAAHPAIAPERAGRVVGSTSSGSDPTAGPRAALAAARAQADRIGAPHALGRALRGETAAMWLGRMASEQGSINSQWESDVSAALATGADMRRAAGSERDRAGAQDALFESIGRDQDRGVTRRQQLAGGRARGAQFDRELGTTDPVTGARRFGARDNDLGVQLTERMNSFAPAAGRTQSVMQNLADVTVGAFSKMADSAGQFFGALIEGQDAGLAFQRLVHDLLKGIAVEATVKALLAGAEGVFRLARSYGADPTGYTLLGNAAMWAGVAAATGIGAAATAPRSAAAATSAGASAAGTASSPTRGVSARSGASDGGGGGAGGGTTIVVNYNGAIYSREHAAREVVAMINDAVEQGVRPRTGP